MVESSKPGYYSGNLLGLLESILGLRWTVSARSCCSMVPFVVEVLLGLAKSLESEDFWQELKCCLCFVKMICFISSFATIDLPKSDRVVEHSF